MVDSLVPTAHRRRGGVPTGLWAVAAVIATVLLWWLLSGNGPQGPAGNDSRYAVPDVDASAGPGDGGSGSGDAPDLANENGVRIDTFVRDDGGRIALNYVTGVPACYGTLDTPEVLETAAAVTVTLTLRPPEQPSDEACPDLAMLRTVRVDLDAELGDRSVLDGSFAQPVRVRESDRVNE